jgi:hypothetical protein
MVPLALLFSCSDANKRQSNEQASGPDTARTSDRQPTTLLNIGAAAPHPDQLGNAITGLVTNVFSQSERMA